MFGDDSKQLDRTDNKLPLEWRVSYTHFPLEVQSIDEALMRYNEMGLPLKI